ESGSPALISDIQVYSNDAPSSPLTAGDLSIALGNMTYIYWEISDDKALPGGAVTLYYLSDPNNEANDSGWTEFATGVADGVTGGCTLTGSLTGCYTWTNAASNSYFKIRVKVTDSNGLVSQDTSSPINVLPP